MTAHRGKVKRVFEWLWDWRVAKPYFVIAGIGAVAMIVVRLLAAIGWLR